MHRHPATPFNQVRAGNFPVVERGHTVLLGWNRQTLATLRQVRGQRGAPDGRRRCLVLA